MKRQTRPTLADSVCDLRTRKIKQTFFTQINTILDWGAIVDASVVDSPLRPKGKTTHKVTEDRKDQEGS